MARRLGLIELNLNTTDELYGWEMHKSSLVISAMREGIRLGQYFPAVDVTKVKTGFIKYL